MICKHCLKEVTQYAPLGYCAQCGVWYKAEGEEIKGVYMLCSTKKDNPEKCNLVVQGLNLFHKRKLWNLNFKGGFWLVRILDCGELFSLFR